MSTYNETPSLIDSLSRPRLLVVDDDLVMRTFVRAILGREYEIVDAPDGREAINILTASSDFACVLADDRMPHATGIDVATFVRDTARLRGIPVIVMTAKETGTIKRQVESRSAGASVFIHKPFTRTQLLALIEMLVKGRGVRKTA